MPESTTNIHSDEETCDLCNEETWLAMVLYEPVEADIETNSEGNAFIGSHPAPQDDRSIAVCAQCRNESAKRLADGLNIDYESVPFGTLKRYLTYQVYPEFVEQLHPEDAERFAEL